MTRKKVFFSHIVDKVDVIDGSLNWKKVYGEAAENGKCYAYNKLM